MTKSVFHHQNKTYLYKYNTYPLLRNRHKLSNLKKVKSFPKISFNPDNAHNSHKTSMEDIAFKNVKKISIIKPTSNDYLNIDCNKSCYKEWLNTHGYKWLSDKIDNKNKTSSKLTNKIKSADLMELLFLLKDIENENNSKLFKYAFSYSLKNADSNIQKTIELVGKIIFLLEKNKSLILKKLSKLSKPLFFKWLNKTYMSYLKNIKNDIQKHILKHKRTFIQNPYIAGNVRLAVKIAKILLTQKGFINHGLIESIIKTFKTEDDHIYSQENFFYGLRMLQFSPKLRHQLHIIKKGDESHFASHEVIRLALNFTKSKKIKNIHAKQVILSAILSHHRQGSDGACFATCLLTTLLSSDLQSCVKDLSQLIESNNLKRQINGITHAFPFLMKISPHYLNRKFTVNKEGVIINNTTTETFIWNSPGIKQAYKFAGIKNYKNLMRSIIQEQLKKTQKKVLKCTVVGSIKKVITKYLSVNSDQKDGAGLLFTRACFAFESQTTNPLLKIWENAIAGMAEANESSMLISAIVESIYNTLKEIKFSKINKKKHNIINKIHTEIRSDLLKRIQLLYDPLLVGPHPFDPHHGEGAFVLYEGTRFSNPTSWKRIDNPQKFLKFILSILKRTENRIDKFYLNENERKLAKIVIKKLISFQSKEPFISRVLINYYKGNTRFQSPLEDYQKMKFTPWVTKSGNHLSSVLKVYFEQEELESVETIEPFNAKDLLLQLLDTTKQFLPKLLKEFRSNPFKKIPIRIVGVHAFSLIPGHKDFIQLFDKKKSTNDYLKDKLFNIGYSISNSMITNSMRDALIKNINKKVISITKAKQFKTLAQNKIPKEISIKQFRHSLLKIISNLKSKYPKSIQKLLIDKCIYRNLTIKDREKLNKSVIQFADSNSNKGPYNLHFCFVINPGSGKLEMWSTFDNKSNLLPLDQKHWLKNQKWKIYY